MNPLPTVSQIREVKHLNSTDLLGPATIARLTGVPLRDVFQITRLPDGIKVADGGIVIDGQHRLSALLRLSATHDGECTD